MSRADAVLIRPATPDDAESVARIYDHYVTDTVVTFEEEPVAPSVIAERIAGVHGAGLPWLVAERDGAVVGYAYAGRWHARSAYRFAAEITVYVDAGHVRTGAGTQLYTRLFPLLARGGIHTVLAGIALPNDGSIRLHERFGLTKVAHYAEVGFKLGRWVDVGYWQRLL